MGTDPRRLDGLRADEQVAARLVERATGATARAHDIGRRQGAYDVHLTYPSGRTAALEVTTHAGTASRNGLVLLGRDRLSRTGTRPRPNDAPPPADPVLTALPAAVSDLLAEPHVARRAAKVAGAGRVDERHLFVGVAEGGLPQPLYERLSAPLGGLPTDAPVVPEGLTHLWLSTEWRDSPLLGWDHVRGWAAHQV
jgi:hypothetical protein